MNYVSIWIQWSWKGTQARLLAKKHGFKLFESGTALREIAKEDSPLGLEVKEIIEAGNHVSPEVIENIMKDILENKSDWNNVIFDGFVRNLWNKQTADSVLWEYTVLLFELSKEKSIARLLWRMYNPKTGETFPSGVETDPKTGDVLEKRADDNEEAIMKRINLYTDLALPLVEWYKEQWNLIEINADQAIEDVFTEVETKLWLNKED